MRCAHRRGRSLGANGGCGLEMYRSRWSGRRSCTHRTSSSAVSLPLPSPAQLLLRLPAGVHHYGGAIADHPLHRPHRTSPIRQPMLSLWVLSLLSPCVPSHPSPRRRTQHCRRHNVRCPHPLRLPQALHLPTLPLPTLPIPYWRLRIATFLPHLEQAGRRLRLLPRAHEGRSVGDVLGDPGAVRLCQLVSELVGFRRGAGRRSHARVPLCVPSPLPSRTRTNP